MLCLTPSFGKARRGSLALLCPGSLCVCLHLQVRNENCRTGHVPGRYGAQEAAGRLVQVVSLGRRCEERKPPTDSEEREGGSS